MDTRLHLAGAIVVLSLSTACGTTPPRGQPDLLAFIVDGRTERSELIARLGQPGRRLQADRLWTYRIGHDAAGPFVASDAHGPHWVPADASLVLVLDDAGVLLRHALVPVRGP